MSKSVTGIRIALAALLFAPLMAYSAPRKLDGSFAAMQRFVIIPLFLFGGAFYPISQLPGWTQAVIKIVPLWHGVELARGLTVGSAGVSATAGHLAVISAWILGGTLLSYRFVRRRLYV